MKKHLFFGLSALLTLSTVFVSCGDDDEEESSNTTTNTDTNKQDENKDDKQDENKDEEKFVACLTLEELKKNAWVSIESMSATKNDQLDFNTMKRTLGEQTLDIKTNEDGTFYFANDGDWRSENMTFFAHGNNIVNATAWTKNLNQYTKTTTSSSSTETTTFTFGEDDKVIYESTYTSDLTVYLSTGTGVYTYNNGYITINVKATTTSGTESFDKDVQTVFYFDGTTAWEKGELMYQPK